MIPAELQSLTLRAERNDVALAFVEEGDIIYLASQVKGSRWPSLILRTGRAEIAAGNQAFVFRSELVSDEMLRKKTIGLFRLKYGEERVLRWYGDYYRIIRLVPFDLSVDSEPEERYYNWLESEFDSIAGDYDHHIYGNIVNSLLRERSIALLHKTFPPGKLLLEVGCGTGTETLELLKNGRDVVAADISQKMLDVLEEKARKLGVNSQLTLVKINAEEIGSLAKDFGYHSFDGIYSTYGAINCVREIGSIPPGFHDLMKPDGRLVMGIYNRLCASEILGYLAKLKFRNAFSRLKQEVPEGESRFCIDVYSYTFMEFRALFGSHFQVEYLEGVPVVILPSNFTKYVEKFSGRMGTIKKIDSRLGKIWPFNLLGDHFLTVMKPRKTAERENQTIN